MRIQSSTTQPQFGQFLSAIKKDKRNRLVVKGFVTGSDGHHRDYKFSWFSIPTNNGFIKHSCTFSISRDPVNSPKRVTHNHNKTCFQTDVAEFVFMQKGVNDFLKEGKWVSIFSNLDNKPVLIGKQASKKPRQGLLDQAHNRQDYCFSDSLCEAFKPIQGFNPYQTFQTRYSQTDQMNTNIKAVLTQLGNDLNGIIKLVMAKYPGWLPKMPPKSSAAA